VTPGRASASGSILPTTSELSEPSYVEMYEESSTPNASYQQALLGACGTALLRIVHLQNILKCRYAVSSEQDREMDDARLEALSEIRDNLEVCYCAATALIRQEFKYAAKR
ncbi:MAG: hypothetical protein ACREDR_38925, partial [Blastocatellia bacterium]